MCPGQPATPTGSDGGGAGEAPRGMGDSSRETEGWGAFGQVSQDGIQCAHRSYHFGLKLTLCYSMGIYGIYGILFETCMSCYAIGIVLMLK